MKMQFLKLIAGCLAMPSGLLWAQIIPEPARSADEFADSIGVASHWNYTDTMYHLKWDQVQKLLGESGIRYVRDGLHERMDWLYDQYGIRAIIISEPDQGSLTDQATRWKAKRHLLSAIEGPNEGNLFWVGLNKKYKGHGWPQGVRLYQDDLYAMVKGDESLKQIDIIAPSTAHLGVNRELAPLSSFDYLVMHSYAGGDMPAQSLHKPDANNLRNSMLVLGRGGTVRPITATESGYHTCLGNSNTLGAAQPGVSLKTHAKYIPRHVAEYFLAGVRRTVIYEFGSGIPRDPAIEPEAAFGLLNQDATPKPAYHALRDLIRLTSESTWEPAKKSWKRPEVNLRALSFALQGAPASVHHLLLQRSDGRFQLLIWNEISSFNTTTKQEIENPAVPVQLELTHEADVVIHRLGANPAAAPEKQLKVKRLTLQVPDEVIVVEINSPQAVSDTLPPTIETIDVKATGVSADLSWKANASVAAYWVSPVGQLPAPATITPDGMVHYRMERLLPATSYPVSAVAVDAAGGVSRPVLFTVTTRDEYPDLAISKLEIEPAHPKAGETVQFKVTVANRGSAPTEPGVTIGTAFSVDGKLICWSGTFNASLAAGAEATMTANGGPTGRETWTMTPGLHRITAQVDDINRMAESDELNNQGMLTVGDGTGPDAVIGKARAIERTIGKPLVIEVALANRGTQEISAKTISSVTALDPSAVPPKSLGFAVTDQGIAPGDQTMLTIKTDYIVKDAAPIRIQFIVDDVDRILELDEKNNTQEITLD